MRFSIYVRNGRQVQLLQELDFGTRNVDKFIDSHSFYWSSQQNSLSEALLKGTHLNQSWTGIDHHDVCKKTHCENEF